MVFSLQILGRRRIASSRHGLVAALIVGISGLSALTACGQKGALYMPVPPAVVQTMPAVSNTPAAVKPLSPASSSQ